MKVALYACIVKLHVMAAAHELYIHRESIDMECMN
jgi:hypothetical protein